jgi:hypothetical protein
MNRLLSVSNRKTNNHDETIGYIIFLSCLLTAGVQAKETPVTIKLTNVTLMYEERTTPLPLNKSVITDRTVIFPMASPGECRYIRNGHIKVGDWMIKANVSLKGPSALPFVQFKKEVMYVLYMKEMQCRSMKMEPKKR